MRVRTCSLLCVVDPELAGNMIVVSSVALGWDTGHLGLCDVVVPALLLAKVDCVLLGAELERSALHVVARRGPSHQRVLPSCGALEDIKVDTPNLGTSLTGRVGSLGRAEDSDRTLVQLLRCAADEVSGDRLLVTLQLLGSKISALVVGALSGRWRGVGLSCVAKHRRGVHPSCARRCRGGDTECLG